MREEATNKNILTTGFAMFSMFFGAGNVVFPLAVGLFTEDLSHLAVFGLLLTAVGVPFLGLISIFLFHGDYKAFFERIGKIPGFLIVLLIMALIGPFGALPRCIALSYSTISVFVPRIEIHLFSFLSCLVIFLLTWRKNRIVEVIGLFLTPFLLLSLAIIVVKGIFLTEAHLHRSDLSPLSAFLHGLFEGYQTMDLLATFFFSSVIIACFDDMQKGNSDPKSHSPKSHRKLLPLLLKASFIGAALLSLVYVGFTFVAAFQKESLIGASKDLVLAYVALHVLGPWAGIFACVAVALACLTTAIALASVFAEYIHNELTLGKIGYLPALILTLIISYFVGTLNFTTILQILAPILEMLYPSLIALSILNIAYKLYGFPYVKVPFFLILALSVAGKVFG